jgi:hypothetical protein
MEIVEASSFDEFERELRTLRDFHSMKSEEHELVISDLLFRGQRNADWPLETTLERYLGRQVSLKEYHLSLLRIKSAVESYTRREWKVPREPKFGEDYVGNLPGYEFMVYARHHGFPSPLLDWTRSPYIALYFAFHNASLDTEVAIYGYIERPDGAKSGWVGAPEIIGQGPYATTHARHFTQQAEYTICVEKPESKWMYSSHQSYFEKNDDHQDYLKKIVLPGSIKHDVLKKLDSMNINSYTLFENDEGLMEMLAFREVMAREEL